MPESVVANKLGTLSNGSRLVSRGDKPSDRSSAYRKDALCAANRYDREIVRWGVKELLGRAGFARLNPLGGCPPVDRAAEPATTLRHSFRRNAGRVATHRGDGRAADAEGPASAGGRHGGDDRGRGRLEGRDPTGQGGQASRPGGRGERTLGRTETGGEGVEIGLLRQLGEPPSGRLQATLHAGEAGLHGGDPPLHAGEASSESGVTRGELSPHGDELGRHAGGLRLGRQGGDHLVLVGLGEAETEPQHCHDAHDHHRHQKRPELCTSHETSSKKPDAVGPRLSGGLRARTRKTAKTALSFRAQQRIY